MFKSLSTALIARGILATAVGRPLAASGRA